MKIYVNARFLTQPVSGVQRYGIECSRQIKKLYPDTVFLAPKNILHKDIANELDVKVIGWDTGHIWEQIDLPLHMLGKGAPLINLANTAPLLYGNNYLTLHDLAFYHHPEWNSKGFARWYNFLVPRLVRKSKHLFTVSQAMRTDIINSYKTDTGKISVTYNGIPLHMQQAGAPHVPKEKIILSVGTFNRRKNHQNLVNAFVESKLKNEYRLVLVGDKHKVFSESGLDEKKLTDNNIEIYQQLSEEELADLYRRAQVVVSLSLYEGFGIPLLEGLYNGCRIVCSDIPVYHELYDQYACFCDPLDIPSISNALTTATVTAQSYAGNMHSLLQRYSYEQSAQAIIDQVTRDGR